MVESREHRGPGVRLAARGPQSSALSTGPTLLELPERVRPGPPAIFLVRLLLLVSTIYSYLRVSFLCLVALMHSATTNQNFKTNSFGFPFG